MIAMRHLKKFILKERDTGPKGGDKQPAHEGGREGTGTRPSGTGGSGSGGQSGSKSGGSSGSGQGGTSKK